MDKSVKNKKPKNDLKYSSDSFFYSISESLMAGKIFVTVTIIIASLIYFNQFELWSTKDECKKYKDYWYEPITRTYKLEHKLQEGNNLWFFMKDTKTGETYDRGDISVSMWMEKNIGDTIVVTSTRIKDSYSSYDNTPGPAVKKLGKFKTYWMNGVLPAVLLMVVIFMFCGGKFDIYSYSKRDRLGCEVTSKETSVDRLIRTSLILFWISTALFVMIRGIIFANI